MSQPKLFDVRLEPRDRWTDEHAPFAERLQQDGDAGGVRPVEGVGVIWAAACGALAFGAVAFAAVVSWTAGGC